MRNRRMRRSFNEEAETKKIVYISIIFVVIAILTFTISYGIYSNTVSKKSQTGDLSKITEYASMENQTTSETSSVMGKTVNEVANEENKDDTKIAINTSNIVTKKETNTNIETKKEDQAITTTKQEVIKKDKKIEDPKFIKPVEGEIIREFAKDNLVYSETLKEWITHTGIDIKADKTTIVKASADGKVKSIKTDPRYGITVVIEHVNGFTSVYSNLMTAEFVKEGEEIKQGQTIGTVGNTATFEILDDSHLHFEILKNNEYLNPSDYIK